MTGAGFLHLGYSGYATSTPAGTAPNHSGLEPLDGPDHDSDFSGYSTLGFMNNQQEVL